MKYKEDCFNCHHAVHPSEHVNVCRLSTKGFTTCKLNNNSKWISDGNGVSENEFINIEFISKEEMML